MKNISKYKIDKGILIPLLILATISIITIYSAQTILPSYLQDLALRQGIWYIVGFGLAYFIMFIGNDFIYDHVWILYGLGILSLIGLFFFGTNINDARCWYSIPGVGTIQPSEFMKIVLIITLGTVIHDFNESFSNPTVMEEFQFLIKVGIIVLIPSILTFLQPDTGVVLIYLLITFVMLFVSGIRYRWFLIAIAILAAFVGIVLAIYFINQDLFVKVFGTSFFLRVDRLLDWSEKSGYQLENGLYSIGAGGIFGAGLKNTPLYFPEAQTDFVIIL